MYIDNTTVCVVFYIYMFIVNIMVAILDRKIFLSFGLKKIIFNLSYLNIILSISRSTYYYVYYISFQNVYKKLKIIVYVGVVVVVVGRYILDLISK